MALAIGKQMLSIERAIVTQFLSDLNSKLTNSDCVWEQTKNKYAFGLKNEKWKNCLFTVCFQHPDGYGGYENASGKVVIGVLKKGEPNYAFDSNLLNDLSRKMENVKGKDNR